MKSSPRRDSSRLDNAEKRLSEPEEMSVDLIQNQGEHQQAMSSFRKPDLGAIKSPRERGQNEDSENS